MKAYHILPETELEQKILADPQIQQGFDFGKPRRGHPEGLVGIHVQKILEYIDLQPWQEYRQEVRILAMLHDTFKYVQFNGGKNHAILAAEYYQTIVPQDISVRDILRHHDTGWSFFKQWQRKHVFDENRFKDIFSHLDLKLYIRFNYADNCLRENTATRWLEETIARLELPNAPASKISVSLQAWGNCAGGIL